MEYGRDHDDEFGGPDHPRHAYDLMKITSEMYKSMQNICKTDVDSSIKGLMLDKMNEAYTATMDKKKVQQQQAWN